MTEVLKPASVKLVVLSNTTLYLYTNPNPNPITYSQCTNSVVYQELGLHLKLIKLTNP